MNHLSLPLDDLAEPFVSFSRKLEDRNAITCFLTAQGMDYYRPAWPFGSATINCTNQKAISLSITKSLPHPLIIEASVDFDLKVTLGPKVAASIMMVSHNAAGSLSLEQGNGSDASIYVLPFSGKTSLSFKAQLLARSHLALFEFGFRESHHETTINLAGLGAGFSFYGLDHLGPKKAKGSSLIINHQAKETTSSQIFRGIYPEEAYGKFLGKVIVEKGAQNSSAKQLYKSILLDKRASVNVMPQMIIYNKEISASHGASIGELDPEALFYLRSRGLSQKEAQELLVASFADDVLDHIPTPSIKTAISKMAKNSDGSGAG
jgi:hypothetical protein